MRRERHENRWLEDPKSALVVPGAVPTGLRGRGQWDQVQLGAATHQLEMGHAHGVAPERPVPIVTFGEETDPADLLRLQLHLVLEPEPAVDEHLNI